MSNPTPNPKKHTTRRKHLKIQGNPHGESGASAFSDTSRDRSTKSAIASESFRGHIVSVPDILSQSDGLTAAWLVATHKSSIRRRELLSVDIPATCDEVMKLSSGATGRRTSLYIISQLTHGLLKIYQTMVQQLLDDCTDLLTSYEKKMHEESDLPIRKKKEGIHKKKPSKRDGKGKTEDRSLGQLYDEYFIPEDMLQFPHVVQDEREITLPEDVSVPAMQVQDLTYTMTLEEQSTSTFLLAESDVLQLSEIARRMTIGTQITDDGAHRLERASAAHIDEEVLSSPVLESERRVSVPIETEAEYQIGIDMEVQPQPAIETESVPVVSAETEVQNQLAVDEGKASVPIDIENQGQPAVEHEERETEVLAEEQRGSPVLERSVVSIQEQEVQEEERRGTEIPEAPETGEAVPEVIHPDGIIEPVRVEDIPEQPPQDVPVEVEDVSLPPRRPRRRNRRRNIIDSDTEIHRDTFRQQLEDYADTKRCETAKEDIINIKEKSVSIDKFFEEGGISLQSPRLRNLLKRHLISSKEPTVKLPVSFGDRREIVRTVGSAQLQSPVPSPVPSPAPVPRQEVSEVQPELGIREDISVEQEQEASFSVPPVPSPKISVVPVVTTVEEVTEKHAQEPEVSPKKLAVEEVLEHEGPLVSTQKDIEEQIGLREEPEEIPLVSTKTHEKEPASSKEPAEDQPVLFQIHETEQHPSEYELWSEEMIMNYLRELWDANDNETTLLALCSRETPTNIQLIDIIYKICVLDKRNQLDFHQPPITSGFRHVYIRKQ